MNCMWFVFIVALAFAQDHLDDAPVLKEQQPDPFANATNIGDLNNTTISAGDANLTSSTVSSLLDNVTVDALLLNGSNGSDIAVTNATEISTSGQSAIAAADSSSNVSVSTVSPLNLTNNETGIAGLNVTESSINITDSLVNVTEPSANVSSANVVNATSDEQSTVSGQQSVAVTSAAAVTNGPSSTQQPAPAPAPGKNLPGLPLLPTNESVNLAFVAKGTYVKTAAPEKTCKQNQDCYNLREPDEWCPLPEAAKYGDKGCFCDHLRNVCVIQRLGEKGDEFTDCAEKTTSACSGLKPVLRIQQQEKQQQSKQNKRRLRH